MTISFLQKMRDYQIVFIDYIFDRVKPTKKLKNDWEKLWENRWSIVSTFSKWWKTLFSGEQQSNLTYYETHNIDDEIKLLN